MAGDSGQTQELKSGISRRWLYLPFMGLILLSLAWIGIWFFAAKTAKDVASAFIARESERGREWVCPNQTLDGFPFRLQLSCDKPQLLVKTPDGFQHEASLGGLVLHARILAPHHFIAVFTPPFRPSQGGSGLGDLSWKSARASVIAGLQGPSEISLDMQGPVFVDASGSDEFKASAKAVEFHVRRAPGDAIATDIVTQIQDLAFLPLDRLSGSGEPIRVEFQARAAGLNPMITKRFDVALDEWRLAGGKAQIHVLKASKGAANIDLTGTLGLDALRRLEGNLQGRAKGLEALTGGLGKKGGLDLGGLMGKIGGGQGLPVILSFQNGQMRYGPFPVMALTPLY